MATLRSKKASIKRHLITSAQLGAPAHTEFLRNLKTYARRIGATVEIIPIPGNNEEDELSPKLKDRLFHIVQADLALTRHLAIKMFNILPTVVRPLMRFARLIRNGHSAIIGSPKQHLQLVPTAQGRLPKIIMSTGACTKPYYRDSKTAGLLGSADHSIGAVFVELDETTGGYHYRGFQALADGSFTDMGTSVGESVSQVQAEALILGDWHTGVTCPKVRKATYKLIKELKPKYLIIHDLFDGKSVNHHEKKKCITRARDYAKMDLRQELIACGAELEAFLNILPKTSEIIVVKSNHDEFLDRCLEEGDFGQDDRNFDTKLDIAKAMRQGLDALEEGIALATGKRLSRVKFLSRKNADFTVHGWELGAHGDQGGNGSKATVGQLESIYGYSVTGHTHTPQIMRHTYVVGTSTTLDLDYQNGGPSSWLNTHGVVWPNGSVQLINIIEGEYRF